MKTIFRQKNLYTNARLQTGVCKQHFWQKTLFNFLINLISDIIRFFMVHFSESIWNQRMIFFLLNYYLIFSPFVEIRSLTSLIWRRYAQNVVFECFLDDENHSRRSLTLIFSVVQKCAANRQMAFQETYLENINLCIGKH